MLVYATHTGTRDITERMEPRGLGGAAGRGGRRCPRLPSAARADGARPGRVPDHLLVRDGLLRLHDAAGVTTLLAHRAEPARAGRLSRAIVYRRRARNPEFSAKWGEAVDQAVELLEAEARRRAAVGVEEPVYYQGAVVGHVRKYSDAPVSPRSSGCVRSEGSNCEV